MLKPNKKRSRNERVSENDSIFATEKQQLLPQKQIGTLLATA